METKFKYNCKDCEYKSNRSDNFKRHTGTHSKENVQCECGTTLSKAAFWRHKSDTCPLKKEKATVVVNPDSDESIVHIETNVRVVKEDGQTSFQHDPIFIGDVEFLLVPAAAICQLGVQSTADTANDVNFNSKI